MKGGSVYMSTITQSADTVNSALDGGHPLGINYEIAVTPLKRDLSETRALRWLLQGAIAQILPDERVSACMRYILPGRSSVSVLYSARVSAAHYGGLAVCGSVWSCPICASKITERRKLEHLPGEERWIKSKGGVYLGTFTLQHNISQTIGEVSGILSNAMKSVFSGKGWQTIKRRYGIVGTMTGVEITWSPFSGWHVHRHIGFFTRFALSKAKYAAMSGEISSRYRLAVDKFGGWAHPVYGVMFSEDVEKEHFEKNTAGEYILKWGITSEILKAPVKKARGDNLTVWDIAYLGAVCGDVNMIQLFKEYASYFKGRRQAFYSDGLRDTLEIGADRSDYEIAKEQEQHAEVIAEIGCNLWGYIIRQGLRGRVLEVAASGDIEKLDWYLQGLIESMRSRM